MADIKNTRSKFHDKIGRGFDIPSEFVESEGDILVKELAQKQINTSISLETELSRENKFQHSVEFLPLTERISGGISLTEFQQFNDVLINLEGLHSYGLSSQEIVLYQDSQKGIQHLNSKYKNVEKSVLNDRLNTIQLKIKSQREKAESIKRESNTNRHQVDLGLCVKPDSNETKLYKFALSCGEKSKDNRSDEHPINKLREIEKETFQHLNYRPIPSLGKRRKKAKRLLDKPLEYKPQDNALSKISHRIKKIHSKWDLKSVDMIDVKKIYSCNSNKKYTVRNNEIVQITSDEQSAVEKTTIQNTIPKATPFVGFNDSLTSLDHIKEFRLSLNEIKRLPMFTNYEQGTPNNVLFVKNLQTGITDTDLMSIFGNFQYPSENKIIYKIMKGKMKGQAFVTFCSILRAREALENINGYFLKGKPIILQYGKKQTSC